MVDPVTIGSLASMVLTMASQEALKSAVGEAVKDAYKSLKAKISQWAEGDVTALEKNPASAARRAVIAEVIDNLPEEEKVSVKVLATALADALKSDASRGPVGFDIGVLEAARVRLDSITVTEGTGFRAQQVQTTGDFEVRELQVGLPPGKHQQ